MSLTVLKKLVLAVSLAINTVSIACFFKMFLFFDNAKQYEKREAFGANLYPAVIQGRFGRFGFIFGKIGNRCVSESVRRCRPRQAQTTSYRRMPLPGRRPAANSSPNITHRSAA
jgi:hypothetical protein